MWKLCDPCLWYAYECVLTFALFRWTRCTQPVVRRPHHALATNTCGIQAFCDYQHFASYLRRDPYMSVFRRRLKLGLKFPIPYIFLESLRDKFKMGARGNVVG
jgi:hypothetical protein